MKVLYVFRSLAVWGGIERILVDKMNCLADMYGMEVYMLTSDQGTHPVPYQLSDRVQVEDLGICFHHQYQYSGLRRFMVRRSMRHRYQQLLASRLQTIKPDVMVCTTADQLDLLLKVKGGIPLVVESHSICTRTLADLGHRWLLRKWRSRRFLRSLSRAEVLVALTEGDAQQWRKYHSHVMVIPNFISYRESTVSPLTSQRAIFVGRLDEQKCVQDAIRVWRIVQEVHPDWVLDIYGDGEMREEIASLAAGVGGVHLHQPTGQIFECYRQSSFLMQTSLYEPFGLVIIEAMSCGLPVVAYDCPYGPASLITDQSNGFLIKERDISAFAEKVCALIERQAMRTEMGKAARLSSQAYDAKVVMDLWKVLFERLTVPNKNTPLDEK